MARIISLIASSTEIVYRLGLGDQMVGRSHECDYPEAVKKLPVCTGPKFSPDGTSYEIDQRVKAILQESLSVYRVYVEKLEELRPTHIITQAQCEVCAVSLKDVEEAVCHLVSSKPQIVSLEPNSLTDIWQDFSRVGEASECTGAVSSSDCRSTKSFRCHCRPGCPVKQADCRLHRMDRAAHGCRELDARTGSHRRRHQSLW